MQLSRAPLTTSRHLGWRAASLRHHRCCIVHAARGFDPSKRSISDAIIEFFEDITEGNRSITSIDEREQASKTATAISARVVEAAHEITDATEQLITALTSAPLLEASDVPHIPGMAKLEAKSQQLQQLAAASSITAGEAIDTLSADFHKIIANISAHPPTTSTMDHGLLIHNEGVQKAVKKCSVKASTGAHMLAQAVRRHQTSSEQAVQYLTRLYSLLANDLAADLVAWQSPEGPAGPGSTARLAQPEDSTAAAAAAAAAAMSDWLQKRHQQQQEMAPIGHITTAPTAADDVPILQLQKEEHATGIVAKVTDRGISITIQAVAGNHSTGAAAADFDSADTTTTAEKLAALVSTANNAVEVSESQAEVSVPRNKRYRDASIDAMFPPELSSKSFELIIASAAQCFVAAEAIAAYLQQQLPALKQQLAGAGGHGRKKHKKAQAAAAHVITVTTEDVTARLSQIVRFDAEGQAVIHGPLEARCEVDPAAVIAAEGMAAAVHDLTKAIGVKGKSLAETVKKGQLKGSSALDELLTSFQTQVSGSLRSSLLDCLNAQNILVDVAATDTSSSSGGGGGGAVSVGLTEGDIAVKFAAAIADARKQQAAAAATQAGVGSVGEMAAWVARAAVGVAALYLIKMGASFTTEQVGSAMSGAVAAMLAIPVMLGSLGEAKAEALTQFYNKYLRWTATLLPLFYLPTLVTVPTLLQGMDVPGLVSVSTAFTAISLLFATAVTSALTQKPKLDSTYASTSASNTASTGSTLTSQVAPSSLIQSEPAPWGDKQTLLVAISALTAVLPLALTKFDPASLGQTMAVPVGAAWSVLGFVVGKAVGVNPMLLGAVAANAGVVWHAAIMGTSYAVAMATYFGQGSGAGELLLACLGVALPGLGFILYKQREHIRLRAVAGAALATSVFSVVSTMLLGRVMGMSTEWTKAFVTRGVSSSSAVEIGQAVGASAKCASTVVLLQAAATVAVGSMLMKLVNVSVGPLRSTAAVSMGSTTGSTTGSAAGSTTEDLARSAAVVGIAAGCTAGGVGVAALSKDEPVALANGILAYAVVHVLSCLVISAPALRNLLQAVVSWGMA